MNRHARQAVIGILGCLAFPGAVAAGEVFVVEAKGIDLSPGQALNGDAPLKLGVGEKVTLVTDDGRTIKWIGPTDGPPAPGAAKAGGEVLESLKELVKPRQGDTSSAGISRGSEMVSEQPAPWLVAVEQGGDRCLVSGQKIVLWRKTAAPDAVTLAISPVDRSWTAQAPWPPSNDKLGLPATLELNDGQSYAVTLDEASVVLTIHVIPQRIGSDAARAAWMIEKGCRAQARALVASMR